VQTTFSVGDCAAIVARLAERFADLAGPAASDICYATTNRQASAEAIAGQADAVIVVGERFSSNATRLAEVAAAKCPSVQLVAHESELDWSRLARHRTIGITAAASTPEDSVTGIIDALSRRYRLQIREIETAQESIAFKRVNVG